MAMENSIDYFTTMMEMSEASVLITDGDGWVLHWNAVASRVYRIDRDHPHLHVRDLGQSAIVSILMYEAFSLAKHSGSWIRETVVIGDNGNEIPVRLSVFAHFHSRDKVQNYSIFTQLLASQKPITDEDRLAKSVLHNIIEGVIVTDEHSKIISINPAFTRITGYREAEVIGKRPNILSSGMHDTAFYEEMWKGILEQGIWQGEVWNRHKNGKIYLQKLTISAIKNEFGIIQNYMSLIEDVTEKKRLEEQIAFQAYHDPLTRLQNRYALEQRFTEMLRHDGISSSVLLLNVDRFKRINDALGLYAGDQVLRAVADRLARIVSRKNNVYHLNGDQFIILLEERTNREALDKANYILAELHKPFYVVDRELILSASIGIATYPSDGADVITLYKSMEIALYHAKKMGRNNAQLFRDSTIRHSVELLDLENDLHRAIEHDQFELYYQPQLDLLTGEIVGVEALVRWLHPVKGLISPMGFIPLAEESGLILKIDEIVLRKACEQAVAWMKQGLSSITVSVNVSMLHFNTRDMIERIFNVLDETGMDPNHLVIELTESAMMNNPAMAYDILLALQQKGIKIAIDDFGTGYTSLGHLRNLPIHALKIDRSFISTISDNADSRALVRSIISLGLNLGLKVVAEGVETHDQLQLMRDYACTEVQGYLIGSPMPREALEKWISKRYTF